MSLTLRTYSELKQIPSFEDRYEYLRLDGLVGDPTFGYDRWMNQEFYSSSEWKRIRHIVIARDEGCDLGVSGFEIHDRIYIHHMNPMRIEDLVEGSGDILDPEYLISTTHRTHNAIHYSDARHLIQPYVERRPGDHIPWKKQGEQA